MSNKVLKVGDKVLWRGAWGLSAPSVATVISIQQTEFSQKYGSDVDSVLWGSNFIVDLDNNRWAYSSQLAPYTGERNNEASNL